MGKRGNESDYQSLRDARISENMARLEMLGLRRAKEELNAMAAAAAPARRPWVHKQYATGPPRRSPRLNGLAVKHKALPLIGVLGKVTAADVEVGEHNAPAVVVEEEEMVLEPKEDSDGEAMGPCTTLFMGKLPFLQRKSCRLRGMRPELAVLRYGGALIYHTSAISS